MGSLNIVDEVPRPKGSVEKIIRNRNGDILDVQNASNLVVDGGRWRLAQLLGGDTSIIPTFMKVGTGGHVDGDEFTPKAPSPAAIDLEEPVYTFVIDTIDYPNLYAVRFWATLEEDEANLHLTEVGLFAPSGNYLMFAYHTFPVIPKVSGWIVTFRWTIQF